MQDGLSKIHTIGGMLWVMLAEEQSPMQPLDYVKWGIKLKSKESA
jgi:hypothetical protein